MLEKIEELRKKPKYVRTQFAFWTAAFVTLIITLIWMVNLPARFADIETNVEKEEEPRSAFSNVLGDMWGSVKDRFTAVFVSPSYTKETEATSTIEAIDFRDILASSSVETSKNTASTTTSSTSPLEAEGS